MKQVQHHKQQQEALLFQISIGFRHLLIRIIGGWLSFIIELEDRGNANHKQQEEEHHDDAEDSEAFALPLSLVVLFDPVPRIRHDASISFTMATAVVPQQAFVRDRGEVAGHVEPRFGPPAYLSAVPSTAERNRVAANC